VAAVVCFRIVSAGIEPIDMHATSLNEMAQRLPCGVYTTFRTYHQNRVHGLDNHFARLEESAELQGVRVQLDCAGLRRALSAALDVAGWPMARARLTVGFSPVTIYVSLEELRELSPDLYEQGVRCALADRALRRENPRSKSSAFIAAAVAARQAAAAVNEVLLLDGDTVLEGSSSNFFAIRNDVLRTAEYGVLAGTTRRLVLRVAEDLLPTERRPIDLAELPFLQEAFITSVSRAVLPVVEIDGRPVGDGRPGRWTREIGRRFSRALEADLEQIWPV
jgi:branched-chain amino acid aminotransferase